MDRSGGLMLYRNRTPNEKEFFLVHPGGVSYRTVDKGGFWGFPKGTVEKSDWYRFSVIGNPEIDATLYAAIREYHEETGDNTDLSPMINDIKYLGRVLQRKSKAVYAFALECNWDLDPKKCYSNTINIEVNNIKYTIPENDDFMWATYSELENIIHPKHLGFYQDLVNNIPTH